MKTLFIITSLFISFSSFATGPVLTEYESKEIVNYLDNICPDTYCGGDYNYYPQSLKCNENSCVLTMRIVEYYEGDLASISSNIGESVSDGNYKVIFDSVSTQETWSMQTETEALMNAADFKCVINNLEKTNNTLNDKTETFYDHTVWSCIPMIEGML